MDGAGETCQRVRAAVAPSRGEANTIRHGVSPSCAASMARRVAVRSKRVWLASHTTIETARERSASSMVHSTACGFLKETVSSRSRVRPKRARPCPYNRPYSDTSPSARTHSTGRRSCGFRLISRRAHSAAAKPSAAGASPYACATISWQPWGSSRPAGSRASSGSRPVHQPVAAGVLLPLPGRVPRSAGHPRRDRWCLSTGRSAGRAHPRPAGLRLIGLRSALCRQKPGQSWQALRFKRKHCRAKGRYLPCSCFVLNRSLWQSQATKELIHKPDCKIQRRGKAHPADVRHEHQPRPPVELPEQHHGDRDRQPERHDLDAASRAGAIER
jgi:hypothetical protein